MKIKIIVLALITFISASAQEEQIDRIVETETRIINVLEDGEMIQKKVKVKTTKEQEVKTNPDYNSKINAPRVFPPTKVSKVIYIDNDNDPFYDDKTKVTYYNKEGLRYTLNPTSFGFEIKDGISNALIGEARFSAKADVYIINTNIFAGIGYFKYDQFVIEYYDDKENLNIERFDESKL
jgi:hypothetical protein